MKLLFYFCGIIKYRIEGVRMKLVTSMNYKEAKKFFLKSNCYFNVDLPKYFNFEKIINLSDSILAFKKLKGSIIKSNTESPEKMDKVDYLIFHNKDGKYAWRPFELIHPILYVNLVNDVCNEDNWCKIKKRLRQMHLNPKIICCSIPGESKNKKADKKANIIHWWSEFEQKSITSSMNYLLMANTDISNCYPSIYTHSISWAIHTKEVAKDLKKESDDFANKIDYDIETMRYGQTNGIPQGSVLMDFIAEIVLGYCDELLTKKLDEEGIIDYKIFRYRDDYRIFSNSSFELEAILKCLSEVLMNMNFKMNPAKTYTTRDVVLKSIKEDKINRFINQEAYEKLSLQKQLFLIDCFGKEFPNSGSLQVLLNNLFENKFECLKNRPNSYEQVISIIVDIMYNNPRVYPICVAMLSRVFNFLSNKKRNYYANLILEKFKSLPNTTYLEIWLQRITITFDRNKKYSSNSLCEKLYNPFSTIWNSDWLRDDIKKIFDENLIIDEQELNNISICITQSEVDSFSIDYDM